MIKNLRRLADWLEKVKCNMHNKWNAFLESIKTTCKCVRYTR